MPFRYRSATNADALGGLGGGSRPGGEEGPGGGFGGVGGSGRGGGGVGGGGGEGGVGGDGGEGGLDEVSQGHSSDLFLKMICRIEHTQMICFEVVQDSVRSTVVTVPPVPI